MFCLTVDERCDMELDETDPTIWLKLESAVEEYIQQNHLAFENACERLLLPFQHEDKWSESLRSLSWISLVHPGISTSFMLYMVLKSN